MWLQAIHVTQPLHLHHLCRGLALRYSRTLRMAIHQVSLAQDFRFKVKKKTTAVRSVDLEFQPSTRLRVLPGDLRMRRNQSCLSHGQFQRIRPFLDYYYTLRPVHSRCDWICGLSLGERRSLHGAQIIREALLD